jgi:nucleoside-diphosphate-sugar epimerase
MIQKFGWEYKTSLKDGIEKTYNYYLKEVQIATSTWDEKEL